MLVARPLFLSFPVTKSLEQSRLFVPCNVIFTFEMYDVSKEKVTISHLGLNRSVIAQIQQKQINWGYLVHALPSSGHKSFSTIQYTCIPGMASAKDAFKQSIIRKFTLQYIHCTRIDLFKFWYRDVGSFKRVMNKELFNHTLCVMMAKVKAGELDLFKHTICARHTVSVVFMWLAILKPNI